MLIVLGEERPLADELTPLLRSRPGDDAVLYASPSDRGTMARELLSRRPRAVVVLESLARPGAAGAPARNPSSSVRPAQRLMRWLGRPVGAP